MLRGALPPDLELRAEAVINDVEAEIRARFDSLAPGWVEQACSEIDARFAGIWAMDLGTNTCVVAIYDSGSGRPVLCPWMGREQFASTVSIDREGREQIGWSGEQLLGGRVIGHITGAKRYMGENRQLDAGAGHRYRAEEAAARLISHGRRMVENMLADEVRQRLSELAGDQFPGVRSGWIDDLAEQHDLSLSRPRLVLTIPAYFPNNAKMATQDACQIAGVELVRLIHEPTAACIAAARERRLSGRAIVVDLGGGTLDLSVIDVDEGYYEVKQVTGDTRLGGMDFDEAIAAYLERQLGSRASLHEEHGRRIRLAAELLKISLSSQNHAEFSLVGFSGGNDVTLRLTRDEMSGILAEPLGRLRRTCIAATEQLTHRPEHLVLVGAPMLAPLIRDAIEDAFHLTSRALTDPRTTVACGAALQAAVLDHRLPDTLLNDVTPFALGIKTKTPTVSKDSFAQIIEPNSLIPTSSSKTFTTHADNQPNVHIEIFSGLVDRETKIGSFVLDGIPPAPKGRPQITVTFSIDASCVLEATATDKATGRSESIRLTDITVLTPSEIVTMNERHQRQRRAEAERREWESVRRELDDLLNEAVLIDPEQSCRELKDLLSAHRPAQVNPDPDTAKVLNEIYSTAKLVEDELMTQRGRLLDLSEAARRFLQTAADDPDRLLDGRDLLAQLTERLDHARPLAARIDVWKALLTRLSLAASDPLERFRKLHDMGDHRRALAVLETMSGPLRETADIRRQLSSLAHTGDAAGYRRALLASAASLGVSVPDGGDTGEFLARVSGGLVEVTSGAHVGIGFLISDRLIVTGRSGLTEDIQVAIQGDGAEVGFTFQPDSTALDVVVIQLSNPAQVAPLPLGFSTLVRIGDLVWFPEPAGGTARRQVLRPGVVEGMESFPERHLHLFRTRGHIDVPPIGGPLFNALGEVVGVVTSQRDSRGEIFVITSDTLAPLLTSAGFALGGDA